MLIRHLLTVIHSLIPISLTLHTQSIQIPSRYTLNPRHEICSPTIHKLTYTSFNPIPILTIIPPSNTFHRKPVDKPHPLPPFLTSTLSSHSEQHNTPPHPPKKRQPPVSHPPPNWPATSHTTHAICKHICILCKHQHRKH